MSASTPNLAKRLVIYSIAMGCGAIVMAFEILGSRVLAPDFGSTIFVWGSLISVFLSGLAAGYYIGGQVSDRIRSFALLSLLIFIPGVMMMTFPLYGPRIAAGLFDLNLGPRLGPLFASVALFLVPTVFLGTVTPYTVRLLVGSEERVGRGIGNITALSTCGSIAGTLGTSFFLILWMGTRQCLVMLGAALIILSMLAAAYHIVEKGKKP